MRSYTCHEQVLRHARVYHAWCFWAHGLEKPDAACSALLDESSPSPPIGEQSLVQALDTFSL